MVSQPVTRLASCEREIVSKMPLSRPASATIFAMNMRTSVIVTAALALAGGTLVAQQKGSAPPAIEFVKVWNDCPDSFEELEGKVVVLDFGATW